MRLVGGAGGDSQFVQTEGSLATGNVPISQPAFRFTDSGAALRVIVTQDASDEERRSVSRSNASHNMRSLDRIGLRYADHSWGRAVR